MEREYKICPRCKTEYKGYPALSRRDNKTQICQICGMLEAMEDFNRYKQAQHEQAKVFRRA